jgi:ABC-2 type transport system permease protein
VPTLSLDVRVLYNPAMESSLFMVPAVMGMILCLVTIVLTSMSLAKERELGTFESIVSAPLENWEILLGKTLPYFLLGLVDALLVIAAGAFLFDVPVRGPLWLLAVSCVVFVTTTVSVGILISTIAAGQQQAMMGSFLFLFTAMLLSGMMFPVENMPPALRWAAYLDPLKYFITLMRHLLLKGGDARVVLGNLSALILMAAAVAALSARRFHQTLN